jgi:hypothetical protein
VESESGDRCHSPRDIRDEHSLQYIDRISCAMARSA